MNLILKKSGNSLTDNRKSVCRSRAEKKHHYTHVHCCLSDASSDNIPPYLTKSCEPISQVWTPLRLYQFHKMTMSLQD